MVAGDTEIGVDRQGYGFFDLDVSGGRVQTYHNKKILYRCRFLDTVPLAKRCPRRFLAILHVRTIYGDHAKIVACHDQVVFE